MRTTLKRGIGRGAELNGNGHAVLPPGVITEMTRYRQPKRGTLRFVGKILFSLFAAALMVGLGLAGGYYLYLDTSVEKLNVTSPAVRRVQHELDEGGRPRARRRLLPLPRYERREAQRDVTGREAGAEAARGGSASRPADDRSRDRLRPQARGHQERESLQVGHADARARGSDDGHDLDAVVPARPARRD